MSATVNTEAAHGQGQISRIESQRDMLLSKLAAYLAALGVDAKIVVKLCDQIDSAGEVRNAQPRVTDPFPASAEFRNA
jgi:hypothetical protein